MTQSVPSTNRSSVQPEIFVGREDALQEFRHSVRCLLGLDQPPGKHLLYPHVLLVNGEGGTGKSALLRQFQAIAIQEGLSADRAIIIALRAQRYPNARVLAQALAETIGRNFPNFDLDFQGKLTSRNNQYLLQEHQNLQYEWALWQSLGELSPSDRGTLLRKHYHLSQGQVTRATLLGGNNQSTYLANRVDLIASQLQTVLEFLDRSGHAPNSFDELLQYRFGAGAGLFQSDVMLGEALANDIADLTKVEPIVLLLDDYEYAEQHDEWLRTSILAQENDRLLVVIAGRNRHAADYRRAFQGPQTQLVRSYNLNARLTANHMKEYLTERLGIADALAEVSTISDGVPLALTALGDHLVSDDSLAPFQKKPPAERTPRSIVRGITQSLLHNSFAERNGDLSQGQRKLRDSQRIRALVLLRRPDPTLACELWGVKPDEGRTIMCDLARRYTFAFAGQESYELHTLVREVVREELLSRTRYMTEWKANLNGLRRARDTTKERIAQIERNLHDPAEHYEHAEWRAATLDLLNILLWLGEDDEARQLLLNRWVEARYADAAFADWLLDQAAELAPTAASWRELIQSLQTEDYDVILPLSHLLDPHIQAILWYMRAQLAHVALVSTTTLPQLDKQIEMLKQSHKYDNGWAPAIDALRNAYTARGAFRLYELNSPSGALADFESILELKPDDQAALSRRAVAKQRLDDLQGARADFDEVLQTNAYDSATRFNRAILLVEQEQIQEALADFDEVYKQHQDDPILLQRRGETRYRAGDLAGALSDFTESLHLRRDDPDTLISRARVRAAMGYTADALADIGDVINAHPTNAEAYSARGELRYQHKLGTLDEAAKDLEESLTLRPGHAPTLYWRGRVAFDTGDWTTGLAAFDQALDAQPGDSDWLQHRGMAKYQLDDLVGAQTDLDAALAQRPDPEGYYYRSLINYKLGELDPSFNDIEAALQIRPDYADARHLRGRMYADNNKNVEAERDFSRALLLGPADPTETYYYRGLSRIALDKWNEAQGDFNEVLRRNSADAQALYQRGLTWRHLDKPQEALKDFDASLSLKQDQPDALYERGCIYAAQGNQGALRKALNDFDQALKLRPGDPEITYQRGRVQARLMRPGAVPDLWSYARYRFGRMLGHR